MFSESETETYANYMALVVIFHYLVKLSVVC